MPAPKLLSLCVLAFVVSSCGGRIEALPDESPSHTVANAFEALPCGTYVRDFSALKDALGVDWVVIGTRLVPDQPDPNTAYHTSFEGEGGQQPEQLPGGDLLEAVPGVPVGRIPSGVETSTLVTFSAGKWTVARTVAEVQQVIGNVETPIEAWATAFFAGHTGDTCGDPSRIAFRRAGDGFEVVATRLVQDCPGRSTRELLHVDVSGRVDVLETKTFDDAEHAHCH